MVERYTRRKTEKGLPHPIYRQLRKMDAPKQKVEYVVVERDGVTGDERQEGFMAAPTPTIDQILSRSYMKRQPTATDDVDDSDNDDDFATTTTTATPSFGTPPPV